MVRVREITQDLLPSVIPIEDIIENNEHFNLNCDIDQIKVLNLFLGVNPDDEMFEDLMAIAKASVEYRKKSTFVEPCKNFSKK